MHKESIADKKFKSFTRSNSPNHNSYEVGEILLSCAEGLTKCRPVFLREGKPWDAELHIALAKQEHLTSFKIFLLENKLQFQRFRSFLIGRNFKE